MTTKFQNPYSYEFVGRQGAIDAFHSLRSLRAQHNVLYLEADGGLGKTRVLREYIEECKKQRRPWHLTPTGSGLDPLIDFYDFTNRTVAGLRRSIAVRLGIHYFSAFQEKEALLHEKENALQENKEDRKLRSQISALRLEVEQVFFRDMARALREIRNYSLLLFDTFEAVYNRRVGRWFLQEFLPNPSTHGCLMVFAGRPRSFQRPANVHCYHLPPFTDVEASDYFAQKWRIASDDPEYALIKLARGFPLLLDLGVHYMRRLQGNVADLVTNWSDLNESERQQRRQGYKQSIVSRFLTDTELENQVIQDMAHLKRRCNQTIYEQRKDVYTEPIAYAELRERLREYPFIKYRLSDDSLALHDIFQEMVVEFGGGDWRSLGKELHQAIVLNWYDGMLTEVDDDRQHDLLCAEQLAYILEYDWNSGIQRYDHYFANIKESRQVDFNDLLWGEVSEQLRLQNIDRQVIYEKTRDQANWMFETGQHSTAVPLFEQITDEQFVSSLGLGALIVRKHIVRLGHCYWRTGQLDRAVTLWDEALSRAEQKEDWSNAAYYAYNLGQVRAIQKAEEKSWTQAIRLYKQAIEYANQSDDQSLISELISEALFVMARLQARNGEYDLARNSLRRSLAIIQNNPQLRGEVIEVQACVYAGDVYRYAQDTEGAKGFYKRAIDLLKNDPRWPDWYAQAYAGLGAAFSLAGSRKRLEGWGGVIDATIDQKSAAQYLVIALDTLRQFNLSSHLSICLNRLADVCVEGFELANKGGEVLPKDHVYAIELNQILTELTLGEENLWMPFLREAQIPFVELDVLGKAQRLLEVAYLQADKMQNPHDVLDSLVSAMRVAQKRQRATDISYYATLANTLKGLADSEQEEIFAHLQSLFQAHLLFASESQRALTIYQQSLLWLKEKGGFGWFKAKKELPEIKNRLLGLELPIAKQCCQSLLNVWQLYPELTEFVASVQDLLPIE